MGGRRESDGAVKVGDFHNRCLNKGWQTGKPPSPASEHYHLISFNFFFADGHRLPPSYTSRGPRYILTSSHSTKTNMNALSKPRAAARLFKSSPASVAVPAVLRTYASQAQEADPQLADYPRLPWVSRQRLPPKGWWDPQMRRNFGDTVCLSQAKFKLRVVAKVVFLVPRKRRCPRHVGTGCGPTSSERRPPLVLGSSRKLRLFWFPGQIRSRSG